MPRGIVKTQLTLAQQQYLAVIPEEGCTVKEWAHLVQRDVHSVGRVLRILRQKHLIMLELDEDDARTRVVKRVTVPA